MAKKQAGEIIFKMTDPAKAALIRTIIAFENAAQDVIQLLAEAHGLDLASKQPFGKLLTRGNNLWKGVLPGGWAYQFHGGSCSFENNITGQFLDVAINKGSYNAIDDYFLYRFIETTKTLEQELNAIGDRHNFSKLMAQLENETFITNIGDGFFPVRILNHALLNR